MGGLLVPFSVRFRGGDCSMLTGWWDFLCGLLIFELMLSNYCFCVLFVCRFHRRMCQSLYIPGSYFYSPLICLKQSNYPSATINKESPFSPSLISCSPDLNFLSSMASMTFCSSLLSILENKIEDLIKPSMSIFTSSVLGILRYSIDFFLLKFPNTYSDIPIRLRFLAFALFFLNSSSSNGASDSSSLLSEITEHDFCFSIHDDYGTYIIL